MDNLNQETQKILEYLPSWMEIVKNPNSNAARFIDAFGIEFSELQTILLNTLNNMYLSTADTELVDYMYSARIDEAYIEHAASFEIEVIYPDNSSRLIPIVESFYELAKSSILCALIDADTKTCYIRRDMHTEYNSINVTIYDETNTRIGQLSFRNLVLHHVWNVFDEIGLILGLRRLKKESNANFKRRLEMIFTDPPSYVEEGIINSLAIEFDLPKEDIEVYQLFDYAFSNTLLNEDGSASKKLEHYASIINEKMKDTWDTMNWDTVYWKSLESAEFEYDYLPHIWGHSLNNWEMHEIQSGVGSDMDLFLKAPVQNTGKQDFSYSIGVSGLVDNGYLYYPEHTFDFSVYATGNENNLAERKLNYRYTIVASELHSIDGLIKVSTEREYDDLRLIPQAGAILDNVEIVPGNTIQSPDEPFLKITSTLKANKDGFSPQLTGINFTYIDKNDIEHIVELDVDDMQTTSDLSSGNYPRINNIFLDTMVSDDKIILTPTDLNIRIEITSEWSSGTMERCYVSNGRLFAK